MKTVAIVVAVTRNGAIGLKGDLLYHLRDDMRHFKALTVGHTVVMGRKTFESLPKGALPDRVNIVVTRNPDFTAPGIVTAPSLEEAIEKADGEIFIIGGGDIYRQALPLTRRLELTLIDADRPDADTFFPEINHADWEQTEQSAPITDPRTGVSFSFRTLQRK